MKSIQLETNELLMYHCGCHGNLVTKATKNVADAYHPKEPPYQMCSVFLKTKEIIKVSIWFAMATKFPWQQGKWLIPIAPRKLHTKYELNTV